MTTLLEGQVGGVWSHVYNYSTTKSQAVTSLLSGQPVPLSIERYSVIPLSPNSGLIGWVPHCDTIHSLIRDYRDKKKIMLNIEHRLMLQVREPHPFLLPSPLPL